MTKMLVTDLLSNAYINIVKIYRRRFADSASLCATSSARFFVISLILSTSSLKKDFENVLGCLICVVIAVLSLDF